MKRFQTKLFNSLRSRIIPLSWSPKIKEDLWNGPNIWQKETVSRHCLKDSKLQLYILSIAAASAVLSFPKWSLLFKFNILLKQRAKWAVSFKISFTLLFSAVNDRTAVCSGFIIFYTSKFFCSTCSHFWLDPTMALVILLMYTQATATYYTYSSRL